MRVLGPVLAIGVILLSIDGPILCQLLEESRPWAAEVADIQLSIDPLFDVEFIDSIIRSPLFPVKCNLIPGPQVVEDPANGHNLLDEGVALESGVLLGLRPASSQG